jgi:hypothetical protein
MKKDSNFKLILISIVGIVFLWLAKELLFPTNYFGVNIVGSYGGEHMNMNGYGFGFGTGSFSVLLVFLIKVLMVLFVVALVVALVMAAKNYLFTSQDFTTFRGGFTQAQKPKKLCETCGKTLEDGWKVCPYCAAEVKEN